MTPFGLETESIGSKATLRLSGELDVSSAPQLRDTVTSLISGGKTNLVFECSGLDFIDSTGLGVLIGARARALAANGSVALGGVKPAMQRLLVVTGIESLFSSAA
jgi:anti-anti-sigma factor